MKKFINYFFYAVLAMTIAACSNETEDKVSIDCEIIVDGVATRSSEAGTVTGGGLYSQGQSCTVEAKANTGYELVSFKDNSETYIDQSKYTFPVPGDMKFTAKFQSEVKNVTIDIIDVKVTTTDGSVPPKTVRQEHTRTLRTSASSILLTTYEEKVDYQYGTTPWTRSFDKDKSLTFTSQDMNLEYSIGFYFNDKSYTLVVDGVTVISNKTCPFVSENIRIGNINYVITYSLTMPSPSPL